MTARPTSHLPHDDVLRSVAADADADALAELLLQLPERRRRELAGALQDLTGRPLMGRSWRETNVAQRHTAQVAYFGTGIARDLRYTAHLAGQQAPYPQLHEVIACRPARVRAGIAHVMLADTPHAYWPTVRDLIAGGHVDAEIGEDYLLGMVRWLGSIGHAAQQAHADAAGATVAEFARDPRIAELLWSALELESVVDEISTAGWSEVLVRAAAQGALDRRRLLEVAVGGLVRDLRPAGTALFRRVAEGLAPSTDELATHSLALIRAVGGSHPSEQRVAARYLRELVAAGHSVDQASAAAAVATPLSSTQKAAAIEALRLLSEVALDPITRAEAAAVGLGHRHLDVQGAAIGVIEGIAAAEDGLPVVVREHLLPWLTAVSPAHRARLEALVGVEIAPRPSEGHAGPPTGGPELEELEDRAARLPAPIAALLHTTEALASVRGGSYPAPARFEVADPPVRAARLEPVADQSELVEVLTILLAGTGDAVDLERAIDGMARIGPTGLSAGTVAALRSQEHREHAWGGWTAHDYVAVAIDHWATGRPPSRPAYRVRKRRLVGKPPLRHDLAPPRPFRGTDAWRTAFDGVQEPSGLLGFLAARLWEAVTSSVTEPGPTLALPTTVDGWLDGADLQARLGGCSPRDVPDRFDAVQALLRLRPERATPARAIEPVGPRGIAAALRRWQDTTAPDPPDPGLARAVTTDGPAVGRLVHAQVDHRYRNMGPVEVVRLDLDGTSAPRRRDDPVGELRADLLVPTGSIDRDSWWTPFSSALPPADRLLSSWALMALPRHRHLLELKAASLLAEDIDQNRSSDGLDAVVSHLVDPDRPLGWSGHLLIAVGVTTRNEGVAAATTDVIAAATADGRLDPPSLGRLLAELGAVGVTRTARVAARLETVLDESVLAADAIRRTLQAWIAAVDQPPRDAHAPLAVLERACDRSRRGVDDPTAAAVLATAAVGSSKRARSATRLLDLDDPGSGPAEPAMLDALVTRAERWASATLP